MSKKTFDYWRPHEPPLNWHIPGRPVIRKGAGWIDDFQPAPPRLKHNKRIYRKSVPVALTYRHWICILQALHHYGHTYGDADWQTWHGEVHKVILGADSLNLGDEQPVAVKLSIEDWRTIWLQVRTACQELGDECAAWFDWLSKIMKAQIKGR